MEIKELKVREFKDNLDKEMSKFIFSKEIKKHPAYKKVLSELYPMFERISDESLVVEEIDELSSELNIHTNSYKEDNLSIICTKEMFYCTRTNYTWPPIPPTIFNDHSIVGFHQSGGEELYVEIDENGNLIIKKHMVTVNDFRHKSYECDLNITARRYDYTNKGVMKNKYFKYSSEKVLKNIHAIDHDILYSFLYVARFIFEEDYSCQKKITLIREMLDTARLTIKENDEVTYSSIVPLNQENGLSSMEISDDIISSNNDIIITRLSKEEIEAILNKENDPIVREGLKEYTLGRDCYSYDSREYQATHQKVLKLNN